MYSTKYISTNKLSQLDLLHKTLNLKEDITKKNEKEDITKKNEIDEDTKTKINNKINEIEAMITELQSDTSSSSITFNNDNESISIQQIPNTSKIGVYKDENIILRIDETGNIYCMNLCPNSIYFGNTDVGQTSKPSGSIVDIVNSDNKETLDNNSLNNKDNYVPSYRVLQENYALKTDVPTGISFPYTNSSNITYISSIKQIPDTPNIGMYLNDTEVIRFGNNGYIYSKGIYPGDIIFQQTTGFGTTNAKWTGYIRNIVNSDNKASADDLNDSNKDMLVPSYRVLQENYALKTDIPPISSTDISLPTTIPKTKIILNETNFNADNWRINVYTDRADKYFSRKTIILRNDSSTSSIYEIYISGIINFVDGKNRNLAGKSIRITFQTSESVYSESITYDKRRDTANGISSVLDPLSSEYDNYILCMFKNYVPEGIETIRINIEIPIGEDALFTDINNIGRYNLLITKIDNIETTGTEIISS